MLVRIGLPTINEEADVCKLVECETVNEQDLRQVSLLLVRDPAHR